MTNARSRNPAGVWQYSYRGVSGNKATKSSGPAVPEPKFRIGPPGVSSGVSFRNLPDASLLEIRKICQHYEGKCSGKYASDSLAGRYVFQMAREIMAQVQALSHNSGGQGQRVRDLETILGEWNENFGKNR